MFPRRKESLARPRVKRRFLETLCVFTVKKPETYVHDSIRSPDGSGHAIGIPDSVVPCHVPCARDATLLGSAVARRRGARARAGARRRARTRDHGRPCRVPTARGPRLATSGDIYAASARLHITDHGRAHPPAHEARLSDESSVSQLRGSPARCSRGSRPLVGRLGTSSRQPTGSDLAPRTRISCTR